jgi:hypothetical protein
MQWIYRGARVELQVCDWRQCCKGTLSFNFVKQEEREYCPHFVTVVDSRGEKAIRKVEG